jgi:hypothetical protein
MRRTCLWVSRCSNASPSSALSSLRTKAHLDPTAVAFPRMCHCTRTLSAPWASVVRPVSATPAGGPAPPTVWMAPAGRGDRMRWQRCGTAAWPTYPACIAAPFLTASPPPSQPPISPTSLYLPPQQPICAATLAATWWRGQLRENTCVLIQ